MQGASKPSPSRVVTRREAVAALRTAFLSLPVVAAALCGSFARDEQTEDSDIDLLVAFEKGARLSDVELTRNSLETATGRNVDIITTLEGQTRQFRDSVKRDGIRIYG